MNLAYYQPEQNRDDNCKGAIDGTWNGRSRKNGREYGEAAYQGWPSMCGLRHVVKSGRRVSARECSRQFVAEGFGVETRETASDLADGPGCRGGEDHRR